MKDVTTEKKSLFVIGENRYETFGFENAPKASKELIKIPLDPSIPIDKITKLKAEESNSFFGDWEDNPQELEKKTTCDGYPRYLIDLVCSGHGTCLGNNICEFAIFFDFDKKMCFFINDTFADAILVSAIGQNSQRIKNGLLLSWISWHQF